jgi:hypothetical protein
MHRVGGIECSQGDYCNAYYSLNFKLIGDVQAIFILLQLLDESYKCPELYYTTSGDTSLSCTSGTDNIVHCICGTKNPSGHIIPGNGNFFLSEVFGLKNRLIIIVLLVTM